MLRKLWCLFVGTSCAWRTERTHSYVTNRSGIYMGVQPPQVTVIVNQDKCEKCGKLRTHEVHLPHG